MKKTLLTLILAATATVASAQWLRVWNQGESTRYAISDLAALNYAGGTITIGTQTYATAEIDSITIVNPVVINYEGAKATVSIPESVEGVEVSVVGADVVVTNLGTDTEQEFILSGQSEQGSFTYNGYYKAKFHLAGLNLQSTTGAAIDIQCGKRIDLILEEGTDNQLADAASGDQRAALNCQGHLEIGGAGTLTISGNARHALRTKEYLLIKKSTGTITIASAASDGIHCGEFFQMNGGELTIGSVQGDGLQVETDATSTEELNGQLLINGGQLTVNVTAADTKGIRLDADGNDPALVPQLTVADGAVTVNLSATALGSKALASDGNITIGTATTSPTVGIDVAAGVYTDPDTDEENRATGIKADATLTIASGLTTVQARGAKSRGVRAASLVATGGQLTVTNTGTKSQGIKLDQQFVSGQGGTVQGSFKY